MDDLHAFYQHHVDCIWDDVEAIISINPDCIRLASEIQAVEDTWDQLTGDDLPRLKELDQRWDNAVNWIVSVRACWHLGGDS